MKTKFCVTNDVGKFCGLFSTEAKAQDYIKRLGPVYCDFKVISVQEDELDQEFYWRVVYYPHEDEFKISKRYSQTTVNEINVWYHANDDVNFIWTHVIAPTKIEAEMLGECIINGFLDKLDGIGCPLNYEHLKNIPSIAKHETDGSYF